MEWMHKKYLLLVILLGMGSLGRAVDIAVLSNQGTVLVPLKYYCAATHARCVQSHGKYIVRKGRKQVVLQLFDRSLMVGRRKIIVPTPPMKLIGVTCIPLRPIARYFGDKVDSTYSYRTRANGEKVVNRVDGRKIIIHHGHRAHRITILRTVRYLDTSRVASHSCAFTVANTHITDELESLDYDSFIARNGKIIWSGGLSTCIDTGNAVFPPQVIKVNEHEQLIAFTGLVAGAHASSMSYFLLRIIGNRVKEALPKGYFELPCTTAEAGIILQTRRNTTQLVVYESATHEAYATNPKHGSYTLSWYRWEHGRFLLERSKKTAVIEMYNHQQLQRLFAQYHISGRMILNDTDVAKNYKEL